MAEAEIKLGDVVWLKSGGPAMTINGFNANNAFVCSWFVENKADSASFFAVALTKEKPKSNVTAA
ncbi:MAG: putative small protein [Chitinophagaceae bacterium]|nr:putative small protein [Chitinophagaceae bacterium]